MRDIKFRGLKGDKLLYFDLFNIPKGILFEKIDQYTGLLDKNGVEIYEGDIISHCDYYDERIIKSIVRFSYGQFVGSDEFNVDSSLISITGWGNSGNTIEVIGNIHENIELLGGKK